MWLWILFGSPVDLIVLMLIVGMLLPVDYEATGRMNMALSPSELWRRLHDPEAFPTTGTICKGVELLPTESGLAVWIEDMGGSKLRIRNHESEEPKSLVRVIEDTKVPFKGRAEFTIEKKGDGCTVTCNNKSSVHSGTWHAPFFRVMIGFFGGAKSGQKDYLKRLSGGAG